jgi:CO/xanthine dehydrogenase Mo-binding subunit
MNTYSARDEFPEPERYELSEPPRYVFELNRREFVEVLGAGLLISVAIPSVFAQRAPGGRGGGGNSSDASLAERLHIATDGTITVFTSKVEVGQGSRTQLTQAAAEELRVPVDQLRLIMADSSLGPNDGGTAGSRTTPSTVPAIRKGCAAARQLLLESAAKAHETDLAKLSVENGKVTGLPDGKSFSYADLARDEGAALKTKPSSAVKVRDVSEWSVLGTPVRKVTGRDIVTGAHKYPSDIIRPGMLYGKILRPPAYGAELESIDYPPTTAETADVKATHDGNFVGFAAPTSFQAERAREIIAKTAKWKLKSDQPSSDDLYAHLTSHSRPGRRDVKGSPDDLLKRDSVHRADYNIAYIQHAPMEPRAAVAEWQDGNLTVWTGTQQPQNVRQELARAFSISADRIRVIVPDTGGGFGGKHSGEVAVEAARLAKAAGKPVHLRWTRQEEFTWAYFRPAGVIKIAAALGDDNSITAWEQINYNSGGSALGTPYAIANTASEFKNCDAPLRPGSYRALASTANIFARESMMDELASKAGENPLAYRLRHLKDERLRNVLTAAAEKFDWNAKWKANSSPQSEGFGLACGTEKGSFAAACVRVSVDSVAGTYKLLDITEAYECGAIQNPRNLQSQVEGAIMQGLGGAGWEEMKFKDAEILNPRFSQYRVPRFKDMPRIETVLLDRKDLASVGAGETPIVAIAPAIANALAHAAQMRIRSLPIRNEKFRSA